MEELSRYQLAVKQEAGNDVNFVNVRNIEKCSSWVGMYGGMQPLKLADHCFEYFGTLEHEFLHALGVEHEHKRPDR